MAYSDKVLDHYENPRNVGTMDKSDTSVGTGMVGAPACGDVMKLQIKVGADGVIEDAKFKTYGCGSAIASSSLVTEWVKGKSLDEALAIYAQPKTRGRGTARPPLREFGEDPISGKKVTVKDGRFGPYVTDGETNVTVPRAETVEDLTAERAYELLADKRAKGPAPKRTRKTAAKKTTTKKTSAKKTTAKKTATKKAATKKDS